MRALFCLIAFSLIFNVFGQVPCNVHNCDFATATEGTTTITFGGNVGLAYSPKCLRVPVGTVVTFSGAGDFGTHPLVSGSWDGTTGSPFAGTITDTSSGTTDVSFNMTIDGANPYYCDNHKASGMVGVIYVGDSCAPPMAPAAPVAPVAATPTTPTASNPVANPVASTTPTKVPLATPVKKTSSAVAVQIGALSLLAVFAL